MCRYTLPVVCLCLHCHQNEAPLVNRNSLRKLNSGCWRVFFIILEFELLVISAWQIPVSGVSDTEELGSSYYTGNAMHTDWQLLAMQTRPGSIALPVNFQPVSTVSCTKLFWFCHLNGSVKDRISSTTMKLRKSLVRPVTWQNIIYIELCGSSTRDRYATTH